jgi:hypothetical protein
MNKNIKFEEMVVKNGLVYVYDEDDLVTINGMLLKDVKVIMDYFHSFILHEVSVDGEFKIDTEEYQLDLSLKFYDDSGEFTIEGRLWDLNIDNSSYFHSFNFESATIEDWIEVYNFININV